MGMIPRGEPSTNDIMQMIETLRTEIRMLRMQINGQAGYGTQPRVESQQVNLTAGVKGTASVQGTFIVGNYRVQFGVVSVNIPNANWGSATVTYPFPFGSGNVYAEVSNTNNDATFMASAGQINTGSMVVYASHKDSASTANQSVSITWWAVGPLLVG